MSTRRNLSVVSVLLFLVVVSVVLWIVVTSNESPAERAAAAAPPKPTLLTAKIEKRILTSSIVTRGTARYGIPKRVSLPASVLKGSKPGLVTMLPMPNTEIVDGGVMLRTSGRPVMVLAGEIPAYRDLGRGLRGKDVKQLEEGLARLGFLDAAHVDSLYDDQTSAAVADWYTTTGNEPFETTKEQKANLRKLEQEVDAAQTALLKAEAGVAAAETDVKLARITAENSKRVTAADVDAVDSALKTAQEDLANANKAEESAIATADHNNRVAAANLAGKEADRERLLVQNNGRPALSVETAQALANSNNSAAQADIDAKIQARAVVFVDPRTSGQARAAADANLRLARANALTTRLQGETAVQTAQRQAGLADGELELAKADVKARQLEGAASKAAADARKAAERGVKLAEQQLALAKSAHEAKQLEAEKTINVAVVALTQAKRDMLTAQTRLDRVNEDLELAQNKSGVQVPADEIVFLPDLPVRVQIVNGTVGKEAVGPLLEVTDFRLAVDVNLDEQHKAMVEEGQDVVIATDLGDIETHGVINRIAAETGTNGANAAQYYTEIEITEPLGEGQTLHGRAVRVEIPYGSTGESVLSVPINALATTGDGGTRIQIQKDDGTLQYVEVVEGQAADGFVEVIPLEDGILEEGQTVIIVYDKKEEEIFQDMGL